MQLSHSRRVVSATFDEPNLVSVAGLVPVMKLAADAGLRELADQHLSVPTDKGANAGLKVASLVGGMVAGADSIDDMAILRHGAMGRLFNTCYAPSTLGSFLRKFTFGHVRQLDAVASRFLTNLATKAPLLPITDDDDYVLVDVDDTIIEVHGYGKQGSGYGYSKVRGLNALLATVKTSASAPVIIAQRLRRGACGSPRGAAHLIGDALATVKRLSQVKDAPLLFRADSAFYGFACIHAAIKAGAAVSVTARMDKAVKKAITTIDDAAWEAIEYTDAIYDEESKTWISNAEVAEIVYTAFTSRKKSEHITGRLVVRRIPELNKRAADGQATLFDTHRFHAFFTTSSLDTVKADKVHRGHAVIEQVNADLKSSALAHLPSNNFWANSAWLVLAVMAFNLSRAAATITGPTLAKATTPTIRRKLIMVPARIASSARRLTLRLPEKWPWESDWNLLFARICGPPIPATF
jgi:Transposase DDE domain group 1